MLALVVRGPAEHALERVPRPAAGPGEAVVAVTHVAMCGTDLRLLRGTLHDADYPVIPGHEWAGEVTDAPDRPELVGRAVVGHNFVACGRCEACEQGMQNLCSALDEVGFTLPGAFAEAFRLPVENLRPLPAGISPAAACLLEPLCVAVHAVERAPDLAGRRAGVIGAGAIGLLVAQVAAAAGAGEVAVADVSDERLAIARRLGLGAHLGLADWHDDPPEVVFDATGVASVFPDGLRATRPGGAYVLVGYSGEERIAFEPSAVMLRELTVIGVLSGYGKLDEALALVTAGAVALEPLVSEPRALSDYRAVLEPGDGPAPLRSFFVVGDDGRANGERERG